MRAMVTGANGFVGSAVVRALLAADYSVVCLLRADSDARNLDGLPVERVIGDLEQVADLAAALRHCDELYHVAALYSTRAEDAERMFRVNVEGTRALLTLAAELGLRRIVHTSTIGTIGRRRDGLPPTEAARLVETPNTSAYAQSKLRGESAALTLANAGAPIVVVNPCAPVGRGDIKPTSTGQRICDYLAGRTPKLSPGGINFVAVEDVAQGHLLAARRGQIGQRYILGNAAGNLNLEQFMALMQRVSGVRPPGRGMRSRLHWMLGRKSGGGVSATQGSRPQALTADPSRAIRELGLPQTPLETAFREAVAWFREQEARRSA